MSTSSLPIAAIGDVHGRADLLHTALAGLDRLDDAFGARLRIYFLGDLVDRGPDSRSCLDMVVEALAARSGSRLLLGNHDDWFLRFLMGDLDDDETANWLDQGGSDTLRSYGQSRRSHPEELRQAILDGHPGHLALLRQASIIETAGRFAFVHAGVDPAVPFDRQRREDCLWIRAPFQRHVGSLERIVVHGHQPQKGGLPVVTENRVSMDTGAVFTDRLSLVVVEPETGAMRFYQAGPGRQFGEVDAIRLDRGFGTALDAPKSLAGEADEPR